MLEIVTFSLGPALTNAYLVADQKTSEAVVIDPAWDGGLILAEAERRSWQIRQIWLTHAHFDHLGGVAELSRSLSPVPPIALHPEDYPLWQSGGGAGFFGFQVDPGPEPSIDLYHGQELRLAAAVFEVRHSPGHTQGHVMFYCAEEKLLFCGDVIFRGSIGRTDLPGGDFNALMRSIQVQVLTLPDETRLLNGHGPETSVGVERIYNPFLST